ncbi:MAG: 4'-phosphopantetheinyl transferase family protein [Solirubrobacterales bacterium]
MPAIGWLTRSLADVPEGDEWLSARERAALAGVRSAKRASDWRLGRWAAKQALAAWSGAALGEMEVLAAEDGAPEALVGGEPAGAALSLSHREGRALAIVADATVAIGCDLEVIEPRSGAFVRTWLAPAERESVLAAGEAGGARLANLLWAAKEAAAKARREGLRLDVGGAVVSLMEDRPGEGEWRPLAVRWEREGVTARGWWREEPGWVYACVSEPAVPAPASL